MYFTAYPRRGATKSDWWAVCKTKARDTFDVDEKAYQEDELPLVTNIVDVDSTEVTYYMTHNVEDVELSEEEDEADEGEDESEDEEEEEDEVEEDEQDDYSEDD